MATCRSRIHTDISCPTLAFFTPDWDGPLLASLYEWTATGKKLQDLPTSDPDAVLVLRLEYLLHE